MFDALIEGLFMVLQWKALMYLLIGAGIGYWVGILPGIGGATTLALMMPFIYKMTPGEAFPFLLGMHSVVQTTGDITSVLFGVPGEATTVAIILDGHSMAKKGEAGRALGAALTSALIGALVGAAFLALCIPIVRPLVLSFGSPEMFMVIILGLTCISTLSSHGKHALLIGLMCAALGFMLSLVGQDRQGGILRFTFGLLYLWNGIPLIPLVVGLFAIPEIIELAIQGSAIAGELPEGKLGKGVMQGVKDTFTHIFLTIRCSLIGTFIGVMPGLGGAVAQWVSYAHATQSAKSSEERDGFGKGDVRGIIGPGAANSKEGAGLIPTVAFGIPSSTGMAVLLGAFLLLGVVPGPEMLTKYLPLTFSMVWTIVIANIAVVAISLLFINKLAKITTIRGNLLIPFLLLLTFIGGYTASNSIGDLIVTLLSGGLGYLMVRYGFPRPPLILGFILGHLAETYFYISTTRYELTWLYRPKVIVIFLFAVGIALYPFIQKWRLNQKEAAHASHR
ncbi:MAG: tripartite tricarboxylate transporter permease [Syntrophales bacterium]|jgi:TctA family transporter|nr:tripartite tricarboxylate transporter permease [Syntrophales bacterium]